MKNTFCGYHSEVKKIQYNFYAGGIEGIVLVKRKDNGKYALVGGFVDVGETVEDAVHREVSVACYFHHLAFYTIRNSNRISVLLHLQQ